MRCYNLAQLNPARQRPAAARVTNLPEEWGWASGEEEAALLPEQSRKESRPLRATRGSSLAEVKHQPARKGIQKKCVLSSKEQLLLEEANVAFIH